MFHSLSERVRCSLFGACLAILFMARCVHDVQSVFSDLAGFRISGGSALKILLLCGDGGYGLGLLVVGSRHLTSGWHWQHSQRACICMSF